MLSKLAIVVQGKSLLEGRDEKEWGYSAQMQGKTGSFKAPLSHVPKISFAEKK